MGNATCNCPLTFNVFVYFTLFNSKEMLEKYFIMFEATGATLNVKSEFFSSCLHKRKFLLKNWDIGLKGKTVKTVIFSL